MIKWLRQLWNRDPEVCFIALDLSRETLAACDEADVRGMVDLFRDLLPFDENEAMLLEDVEQVGDIELLKSWCLLCVNRRNGYVRLGILPVEMTSESRLTELLSGQRWVQGVKIVEGKMTEVYAYLLRGLEQAILIPEKVPESKDLWQVVPITLGPVPLYPYDSNEPMNVATRQAAEHGVTVIVAAGNEARLVQENSLNPWSVAPWVIGVGATNDEGTQLLEVSSRGEAGQPYDAPTVVALGETTSAFGGLNHGHQVALQEIEQAPPGSVTTAVVGSSVYNYVKDREGRIGVCNIKDGVASPVVPLETVKEMLEQEHAARVQKLRGTSFAAEYVAAICNRIVKHIQPRLPNLPCHERPKLVKTVLEDMAQPFGNLPPWEIGKGFVSHEIAEQYLRSLSAEQLDKLVGRARTHW